MAIEYLNSLKTTHSAKFATADLNEFILDEANPRFASSPFLKNTKSANKQNEIINHMVKYAKIIELANSIKNYEGLFNEFTISAVLENGKLKVLEGNRRISACKILLDPKIVNLNKNPDANVPSIDAALKSSISKINVVVYTDPKYAQTFIAARHTEGEVKRWSSFEQQNYYYTQFKKGLKISEIAANTSSRNEKNIKSKIEQYALFSKVFELLKTSDDVAIEEAEVLPFLTKLMPYILNKNANKKYSIDVTFDLDSLEYTVLTSKKELFNEILTIAGEAFFIRPKAKKQDEKDNRNNSNIFRITTPEVNKNTTVEKLIEDDIRIPGLKKLILKFNNEEDTNAVIVESVSASQGSEYKLNQSNEIRKDNNSNPNNETPTETISSNNNPQYIKEKSFFANLNYSNLDPNKSDETALFRLCKEIVNISTYSGGYAYKNFPYSSTFLLRAILEQTLILQLKKKSLYIKLLNGNNNKTPALEKITHEFISKLKNGNYLLANNDLNFSSVILALLEGNGTLNQMHIVIHTPEKIKPDVNFLNSLADNGLFYVLQTFIKNF